MVAKSYEYKTAIKAQNNIFGNQSRVSGMLPLRYDRLQNIGKSQSNVHHGIIATTKYRGIWSTGNALIEQHAAYKWISSSVVFWYRSKPKGQICHAKCPDVSLATSSDTHTYVIRRVILVMRMFCVFISIMVRFLGRKLSTKWNNGAPIAFLPSQSYLYSISIQTVIEYWRYCRNDIECYINKFTVGDYSHICFRSLHL